MTDKRIYRAIQEHQIDSSETSEVSVRLIAGNSRAQWGCAGCNGSCAESRVLQDQSAIWIGVSAQGLMMVAVLIFALPLMAGFAGAQIGDWLTVFIPFDAVDSELRVANAGPAFFDQSSMARQSLQPILGFFIGVGAGLWPAWILRHNAENWLHPKIEASTRA